MIVLYVDRVPNGWLYKLFCHSPQSRDGFLDIVSRLFYQYKLITKSHLAYGTLKLYRKASSSTYLETAAVFGSLENKQVAL